MTWILIGNKTMGDNRSEPHPSWGVLWKLSPNVVQLIFSRSCFLKAERLILSLVCLYGWLLACLLVCGQLYPSFTPGGSWDFLKLERFTWLLSFLPIIQANVFCLGYQPVTQKSNKPDKWLRSDTMLKSILVYRVPSGIRSMWIYHKEMFTQNEI